MRHFLFLLLAALGAYWALREGPASWRQGAATFLKRHGLPVAAVFTIAILAFVAAIFFGPTTLVSP